MNTFGINKPLNSFGLGSLRSIVTTVWHEVAEFSLKVATSVGWKVKR